MLDHNLQPIMNACQSLGQCAADIAELMARQPRFFVFSILISGMYARLLRWDRVGCVVSRRIGISEQPEVLHEFLRRFSKTCPVDRGYDTSFRRAPEGYERLFYQVVSAHVSSQLGIVGDALEEAVQEHYEPGNLYTVDVLQHGTPVAVENIRSFLVSRPVVSSLVLISRGTKGFWAVDLSTSQLVFMKDTWRTRASNPLEADTLKLLAASGIEHIPSVVWYGDVPLEPVQDRHRCSCKCIREPDFAITLRATFTWFLLGFQETRTDEIIRCLGASNEVTTQMTFSVPTLRHHRLILGTVGYGFKHVQGSRELLHAAYDVYKGKQRSL